VTQPNENAEGIQVWDPSVGLYFKPAANNAESYGGIVGALQDLIVEQGREPEAYPYNFAGIIAAIQDLTLTVQKDPVGSTTGTDPGGGSVVITDGVPEWIYTELPEDGQLWFDTRQGRLLVAYENQWYQTNGADGVPIVTNTTTPPSVTNLIIGQLWWVESTEQLYIFDGRYTLPDNTITTDPNAGGVPIWVLISVSEDDYFQNTGNLPLVEFQTEVQSVSGGFLPDPPLAPFVQSTANQYFLLSLQGLNDGLEQQAIYMSTSAPNNPVAGQLWFDIEDLEMSIFYIAPGESYGQWVPTAASYTFAQDVADLQTSIRTERGARILSFNQLETRLQSAEDLQYSQGINLTALRTDVDRIDAESIDLSPYAIESQVQAQMLNLQTQIGQLSDTVGDLDRFATDTSVNASISTLTTQVADKVSQAELAEVEQLIPSLDGYATQGYVAGEIAALDTLSSSGGTITGTLKINNATGIQPGLDFTDQDFYGRKALGLKAVGGTSDVTFGTTTNQQEIAFEFQGNEDIAWIHDGTKVASIASGGLAVKNLVLADFLENDSTGRRLNNTIDVRAELNSHQIAFEEMRQNVTNATDFASLQSAILTALQNL